MRLTKILTAAALFLLGACQSAPQSIEMRPIAFTRYQPIHMNVASIEVVDAYKSPLTTPYVEHRFPYSPAEAMRVWVRDRLRAVGDRNHMQVIIKDASVIATPLPTKSGVTGLLTVDQDRRYDARLEVEMRIYGEGRAISLAHVGIIASRSITMGENASVNERERVFRKLIYDLTEAANAEAEKYMFMYMGNYINYSMNP